MKVTTNYEIKNNYYQNKIDKESYSYNQSLNFKRKTINSNNFSLPDILVHFDDSCAKLLAQLEKACNLPPQKAKERILRIIQNIEKGMPQREGKKTLSDMNTKELSDFLQNGLSIVRGLFIRETPV